MLESPKPDLLIEACQECKLDDGDFSENLSVLKKNVRLLFSKVPLNEAQLNKLAQILCQKAKIIVDYVKDHPDKLDTASFALLSWTFSLGHYTQEGVLELKQALNAISALYESEGIDNFTIGTMGLEQEFVKKFNINKILEPTESDSRLYKKIYYHLKELQQCHLLGHRFGIKGDRTLLGVKTTYQNAYAGLMQRMLKDSYNAFHQDTEPPIKALQSIFENIDEDELKNVFKNIYQDVIQVNEINEKTAQRLKDNHNISITITSLLSFHSGHFTCMVGNNEFLVYGDRYPTKNNGSGLEVMAFDEKTTRPEKIALLESLSNKGLNELDNLQGSDFLTKTKEKYNLKTLYFIERSAQKADTCGWASSAKLVVQANAFLHFYNLAKKRGIAQEECFIKAQEAAKVLYDTWSKDYDRVNALQEYLAFHETIPAEYNIEHDKLLLSMILLQSAQKQSPFRQRVAQIIDQTQLIDDVTSAQAQEKMTDIIEEHLEDKANKYYGEKRAISFNTLASERIEKEEIFDEKRYTNTYLKEGTKEADAEIEERVQETLRERLRNKDKREKEKLQNELSSIIDGWRVHSNNKFEEIKYKLDETLKKGATLTVPDSDSNYAIKKLLEKYINFRQPVQGEIAKELDKCLEYFLENGAPLNLEGKSLIHEVSTEGALLCLLRRGLNIDEQDSQGETLLMKYISYRYTAGVEFLLKHGADISLKDKEGHDAMFYAQKINNEPMIKLLENRAKPDSPKRVDRQ